MTDKQFDRAMDAFFIAAAQEYSLALINASLVWCSKDIKSAEGLASLAKFIVRKEEYNGCVTASDFIKTDETYANNAIDHMDKYRGIASVAPDKSREIEAFARWSHYDNHGMLMMYAQWIASIAKALMLVRDNTISREDFDEWIELASSRQSVFRLRKRATAKAFIKMRAKVKEINEKIHDRQTALLKNQ